MIFRQGAHIWGLVAAGLLALGLFGLAMIGPAPREAVPLPEDVTVVAHAPDPGTAVAPVMGPIGGPGQEVLEVPVEVTGSLPRPGQTPRPGPPPAVLSAPHPEPQSEAQSEPQSGPQSGRADPSVPSDGPPVVPRFDLVRIDDRGEAVVAGRGAPNSVLAILIGDRELTRVTVDGKGAFVTFLTLPEKGKAAAMRLRDVAAPDSPTGQTVLIAPSPGPRDAPVIALADAQGARLVQPEVPQEETLDLPRPREPGRPDLALETIAYDERGDVVLSGRGQGGRGQPGRFVRVYMDNTPLQTEPVAGDGTWRIVLPDVEVGTYTLRVDQIAPSGAVVARVESPFRRVSRADLRPEAELEPGDVRVTVQPGHSLWLLAEERYGAGVKYVQIFRANRDRIRDADLIYPGQIFELPAID